MTALSRTMWLVSALVFSMLGAIFGPAIASAVVPDASTSADETLVYVPIAPCKVFAGIGIDGESSGDVQSLAITQVPAGTQGSDACAVNAAPSNAVAATINLIAQNVQARGNVQIGPMGGNTESVLNFVNTVDMNNSTEVTTELAGGAIDLDVGGSGTGNITNVVTAKGVLLGYWIPGTSVFESFERTVVVPGSGTPAQNGTALQNAVAAVNGQSPSAANPWLIKLEPGVYEVNVKVTLVDGVSLQGSGQYASTVLTTDAVEGLITINDGELSDVNVRHLNTTETFSKAILVPAGAYAVLTDVSAEAGRGDAVHVDSGAELRAYGVTATTTSSSQAALDSEGVVTAQSSSFRATSTGIGVQVDSGGNVSVFHSRITSASGDALDSDTGSTFVARQSEIAGTTSQNGTVDCLDTVSATAWLENTCS